MGRILYLTSQSVTLFHANRHDANVAGRFILDETGYLQLRETLAGQDTHPVCILVDLIEEEFREELLPHTYGLDRAKLLSRNEAKLFRSTPFRHSRMVGRLKDGRRDSRVLFSALTNRDNVEPLLELLNELRIPLAGIYSLPLITHHLVKYLPEKNDNVLVITEQPGEGLRETFVRNDQVLFSRLAPISNPSPEDYCQIIRNEVNKTQRYLNTLKLIPYGAELKIYALTDSVHTEAMRNAFTNEGGISYHPVNLAHVAHLAGFRSHPDTRFSDALFAYLLNTRRAPNHYAKTRHQKRLHTWQARIGLQAAMWLVAVTGATYSGLNVVDGLAMSDTARNVVSVSTQVNKSYQQAVRQLPVKVADARAMREAIELADKLEAHQIDLDSLFSLVGTAFEQQSNLKLKRFDWFTSPDRNATAAPQPVTTQQADPTQSMDRYLISNIKGQLRHFSGSYLQAHRQIENLTDWIAGQPGIRNVEVIRRPLNTHADASIHGEIGNNGSEDQAEFELRITMEINHGSV